MHDWDETEQYTVDTSDPADVPFTEMQAGAARDFGKGTTFMDRFGAHKHAHLRRENLFYPFASRPDWEIASWLLRSGLSMAAIDTFLSLELVGNNHYQPFMVLTRYYVDPTAPTVIPYCKGAAGSSGNAATRSSVEM